MPTFNTQELLVSLRTEVENMLKEIETIRHYDDTAWSSQPAPGKWSAIQVLEHLNSYNRYYLPEIEKALASSRHLNRSPLFKAGVFGNYFTNMMLPKADGKVGNKMNAPKDHRPPVDLDRQKVIEEFVDGQQKLVNYLKAADNRDIAKLKVPISISKFIKLKLGDTFRFLIAHQQRHFIQLRNALHAVAVAT